MILVDTSVWIDHLHATEAELVQLLETDAVGCHPFVIQELALGRIEERSALLDALGQLTPFPVLSHTELLRLVEAQPLWDRGLSAVDAHLLGSVLITPGARLWTRNKRLRSAAEDAGAVARPESPVAAFLPW